MATRVETLRRNKSRADEHAFNRQVSIDEAKRTAAWIFKTVNELPWQQKAIFLTVAIGLVAGGVGYVQHNNIGGAKDNFKAWANAFNLTDGGDSPVVILTPTPDVTVGVNQPQLIPPAGDMSTPTTVKSTETSTLAPTATKTPEPATATPISTATSTLRPINTQAPTNRPPEATATPKPTEVQNGVVATLEAYGGAKIFVSYNPLNYNLPSGNKGSWVLVDCRNRPIENWVGCPNVNVGIQYRTSAEALAALNSMFPGQIKETAYGYYQRSDVGFPTTGFLYWSK